MNEISNKINSIEEFRACYEHELKEILEELNKKGVTNIEGVEETIKLFFDEYYQYLSMQFSSDKEVIEELQRLYYNFKEKQQYLECFNDIIPQEIYSKLDKDNERIIRAKKLRFSSEDDINLESYFREYIITNLRQSFSLTNFFLKLEYKSPNLFVGSIMYNGNLKRLEELLNKHEKNQEIIKNAKNKIEEITTRTITDIDIASLKKSSYTMPSDLFDEFNSYLFKKSCEGLYLDTYDMYLGSYKSFTKEKSAQLTFEEKHMIGKRIKITEEDLKEYLASPITFGSFWKENIIEQFLKKFSNILYQKKLRFWFVREGYDFSDIESIYDYVNRKRKIRILPKSRKLRRDRIFWDIKDSMERLNNIKEMKEFLSFCQMHNKAIYLNYEKVVANIDELSKLTITNANIEQLKTEFLDFLDSIKQYRIELAMEMFDLTKEKVIELSNEELEQRYLKLEKDNDAIAKRALEKLKTNKQESMSKFLPDLIKENIKKLEQTKSTIEISEKELVTIDQDIRNLADESVQDSIQDTLLVYLPKDNSELCLYIIYKLLIKYIKLIAPKILENATEREQVLLDNYKNLNIVTPYGLQDTEIPVIGPKITRTLENKK
mgnify:CR=1 FL=1